MNALAAIPSWSPPEPVVTEVSATLPVSAAVAFAAFADVATTPRWMTVVQSARVTAADDAGRPLVAAFLARLERATLGYTLHYRWDPQAQAVSWSTPEGSSTIVAGHARFVPLSSRASLLHYQLALHLPLQAEWAHGGFGGNAAAAVVSEFREHLRRAA